MSQTHGTHFSPENLRRGEQFQEHVTHSVIGRKVISLAVGSSLSFYRQLNWRSEGVTALIPAWADVPGDPEARGAARFWKIATVIAASVDDLAQVRAEFGGTPTEEAVVYLAGDAHVGTYPEDESIFHEVDVAGDGASLVAVSTRLGKGGYSGSLGYFDPVNRIFRGANTPRILETAIPVAAIAQRYSDINLV